LQFKNARNAKLILIYFSYILSIIYVSNFKINTKEVSTINSDIMLIPSGQAVGMKLKTSGVLVVGVKSDLPAKDAGIKNGDIIKKVNDVTILNTNHFEDVLKASNGSPLTLTIERKNALIEAVIKPMRNESEQLICGMWLRDSAAGIGTISFFTEDLKYFAALGHPINDVDTEKCFEVRTGVLQKVNIKGADMGAKNDPGELLGIMSTDVVGSIIKNDNFGIYGELKDKKFPKNTKVGIIPKNKVKLGKAKILSTISENGVEEFDIEVVKVSDNNDNKDFIIKITDPLLLEKTGGIVQGMSGSPILQNGKLIGAVTHVMLSDPKKGFGISIEKMIPSV
jgi:stage IV sporulation protein B